MTTATDCPAHAEALRQQIETAQVSSFENTGCGFFSHLQVAINTPLLTEKSPLDGAHGKVLGIDYDMGFLVFLDDGRISMIEGYTYGDKSTADIDFSQVTFDIQPWSSKRT